VLLTAIEFRQIQGNNKETGKPYNFPTLIIADENLNRFSVSVNRDDLVEGNTLPTWLIDACEAKEKFIADVKVFPNKDDKYGRQCQIEISNLREE